MNSKIKLLIGILVFAVIIGGAYIAYDKLSGKFKPVVFSSTTTAASVAENQNASSDEATEPELEKAPDFTVIDKDGKEHKLSDFKGKPVVLNFWASWCGPCKMEMPDFNEMYKNIGDEVQFMMVNLTNGYNGETFDTATAFMAEQGYDFPVFYDTENDAGSKYYTYSIPVTYFIDKEGNLVVYASGAIDADTLQQGIDMIYEG